MVGNKGLLGKICCCKLVPSFGILLWRNLSVSQVCLNKFDKKQLPKQARILKKLLSRDQSLKKKTWYWSEPRVGTLHYSEKKKLVSNPRRIQVLNALFMEKITEVMSTGEIGAELQGYGLEILYVKVSLDFTHVNVYWAAVTADADQEKEIGHLLSLNSSKIRSELIAQHVLGNVPQLNFVRDKVYSRVAEVERLLKVADFGPEVLEEVDLETKIPLSLQETIKERISSIASNEPELSPLYKFPESSFNSQEEMQSTTENLEDEAVHNNSIVYNLSYPQSMRLDILGLDYKDLMEKVIRKKMLHRNATSQETLEKHHSTLQINDCNKAIPGETLSELSDRNKHIKSFLQSRKKIQAKEKNTERTFDYDFNPKETEELSEVEEVDDYLDEEQHYNDKTV